MKLLSLALTLLIATSGAADAGPVAALFSAVAGWFATTFGAALGGFLVNTLSSIALSALSMAIRGKQQIEQPGIRTETTTAGGTVPQRLIFGRYATAGNMVVPMMVYQTDGNPNEWLVYVIALADTPTNGLGRIFVDGKALTIDGDPAADLYGDAMGATVLETAKDSLRNKVYVRYHDGNQTAADAYLRRVFASYPERPWTADMVGYGVSYVVVTFKGKAQDGNYSGFPSVKFEIDGCKLRDPRTGTDVFTKNPAVIAYNILRGIDVGGETWGVGTNDFSMSHIIAAANLCDESVPKDGGGVRVRYQAGLEISVEDEPHQALMEFLKAMGGDVADMGGTWLVSAGEPSGPVLSINDDDIIVTDSRTLRPYPGLDETVNAIHASYPDPAQQWEPKEAVPLYNAAYEASDGGRRLVADVNYPAVPYPMQVRALMREMLADHRRMRNHVITLPPDALGVKLGEHIAWTSATNGYIAKLFKVCAIRIDPTSLCIALTLTERDPNDYDYDPQSDGELPTIPSSEPVVPTIEGITGWGVEGVDAGGRPGIRMFWDPEINARAVSWRISVDATNEEANSGTTSDISAGDVTVTAGLRPNTAYRVTGRLVMPRQVTETQVVIVTTPDVRLGWDDFTEELRDELDVAAAQIDAAEAEAAAASAAAQQALADAAAAVAYTDAEVQQVRDDLAVDFQTAINAAGQADTAMLAAQQARDAALGHKQDAETAKQAAQNAKTAAEQAKALAEAQALAASNSAGAAAGSASTASSKATEAEQSATAAAAQVVIAKTGAARVLPAEITDDYWRHYLVGVPGNAGLNPQVVKNDGYVTVPASDTGNVHFISQAGLPWIDGRTYRITVTARAAQPGYWIRPLLKAYLPDFTAHSWGDTVGILPLAGTGDWETVSIEKTLPALPDPTITQFRIGVYTAESILPDIDIDLRSILVEDVTSEKSAAGSAAAAVQAQQAASASETAAGQQAAAAANSATTASTKAGQASTSASNAAQSETNAAGSASAASQSATTAAGSATTAGQKATAAAGSASTASTKASEAAQSATAAASSATTASTKAGEASTSAQQASASKTDAAGSASAAASSATTAANSATTAGQKATAASTSASQASTHANAAGSSAAAANTAKLAAESARDGSVTAKGQAEIARNDAVTAKNDATTAAAGAMSSMNLAAQIAGMGNGVLSDQFLQHSGWFRSGSQGSLTKTANQVYPIGQTWDFTFTDSQNDGIRIVGDGGGLWFGQKNAKGYVVEVEFTHVSGSMVGAGVLLDWNSSTGGYRASARLPDMQAGGGDVRVARAVFKRPSNFAGNFLEHNLYVMANYTGAGLGPRVNGQIKFHRINVRVATEEEMGSGEVMAAVQAKLSNEYLTAVQTNQAISSAKQSVEAQLGTTNAAVTKNSTALTSLNGSVARFSVVTNVNGGKQAAGLEIVSFDGNGVGTGSAIVLNAMNIIAKGTLSTDALVVGLGKNLLIDPTFSDGLAHYIFGTQNGATAQIRQPGAQYAHPGYPTLGIFQNNGNTAGQSDIITAPVVSESGSKAPGVPVQPGKIYTASAYFSTHRCNSQLLLQWVDASGSPMPGAFSSASANTGPGDSSNPDLWPRVVASGPAPTGAVYARLVFRKTGTLSGQSDSYLFIWKPQLEESAFAGQEPSPWSPGGTTFINGGRLFANSITTRELAANSVTAEKILVNDLSAISANLGSIQVTTPVIAPNAISRMVTVSTTTRLRKNPHFDTLNTWVGSSPDPYDVPQKPGWLSTHSTLETRAKSYDYLSGVISAPYEYDLYFWVALSGGDCVANLFLNSTQAAYQGYRYRVSLDVWDHKVAASGSMVGCVPGQTGSTRLTIGFVGIDGSQDVNVISGSMTMMAVMK